MARLVVVSLSLFVTLVGLSLAAGNFLPHEGQVSFDAYSNGDWDVYLLDVARGFLHNLTALHHNGWDRDSAWSSDGKWLAYTSVMGLDNLDLLVREVECESLFQLCSGVHNITNNPGNDYAPVWSPDGTQITFVSERDYNREVYVMDGLCFRLPDGCKGNARNLSQHPDSDITPNWSPDGSQIAFVSERNGAQGLYFTHPVERDIRPLVSGFSRGLLWSPDGTRMAYVSGGDLYVAENGCQMTEAGCGDVTYNLTNSRYNDWLQSWSPDSRQIMFQSNRSAEPQVYITDVDCVTTPEGCTDNARLLTSDLDFQLMAAWSPDGDQVVVMSNDTGHMELYLVNLKTASLRRLTYLNTQIYAPHWRPTRN